MTRSNLNKFILFIPFLLSISITMLAEDTKPASGCDGMLVGKDQKSYAAEIEEAKKLIAPVCTNNENAYLLKSTLPQNKNTLEKCVRDYDEFKKKMQEMQKVCTVFEKRVRAAEQACKKQAGIAGGVTEKLEAAKVGTLESKPAEELNALAQAYKTRANANKILSYETEQVARGIEKGFGAKKETKNLDLPTYRNYLQEQRDFAVSRGQECGRSKLFFDDIWISMRDKAFPALQKLRDSSQDVADAAKKSVPEDIAQATTIEENAKSLKTASDTVPVAAAPAADPGLTPEGKPKILDSEYQKSQREGGPKPAVAAEPAPKAETPAPVQTAKAKSPESVPAAAPATINTPATEENPYLNPSAQEITAMGDAAPPFLSGPYNWPDKHGYRRAGIYVIDNKVYQVWVDANGKKMALPK